MQTKISILLFFVSTMIFAQDINQLDANGKRHGIWRKNFDKTKVLRYEGEFSHGKEIGIFKFYKNINGKSLLTATRVFNDNDNIADVKFYTSKGKVLSEGQMDGKRYIGVWKYYQTNSSQLLNLEHYNNGGLLQGERLVYYDNGQIAQKELYKDGKLHGISSWYSDKGIKIKEFHFENDELHGLSQYYSTEGHLIVEGSYKRDRKHGIWKYYNGGKLVEEKDFTPKSKYKKKP